MLMLTSRSMQIWAIQREERLVVGIRSCKFSILKQNQVDSKGAFIDIFKPSARTASRTDPIASSSTTREMVD